MFPKTFRVSDTVEWRWKIVPGERTGVWEHTLADLSATKQLNVLSGVGGSQTGPHLVDGEARTMSEKYVGHWPVWIECILVHNLKSTRRATSGTASELVSRVCSSVGRESAAQLRSGRVEAAWSPTLADRLKLSCLERTNECTSWATSSCRTGQRIWQSRRSW